MNQHPNFPLRANQPSRDAERADEIEKARDADAALDQARAMRHVHEAAKPLSTIRRFNV